MNTPLISIIVPVYNVEPYVRPCLDSLVGQTLKEIEIICVNDGCTDGSPAILEKYAAQDERVRVIHRENGGLAAARNSALEVARAAYIMCCDSDDWFEPDMCEKMYAALEAHPQADAVVCSYENEWERESEEKESVGWLQNISFSGYQTLSAAVMKECLIGMPFKILRRELIERLSLRFPEGLCYEDFYFWHVYAAHARGLVFLPDRLYHYRQRAGSIMQTAFSKNTEQNKDYLRIADLLWDYFKAHSLDELWDGYVAELWAVMVGNALRYSSNDEAREYIMQYARDFVARECAANFWRLPWQVFKALVIVLEVPSIRTKCVGGLLHFRYSLSQITYRLCGIPIYRIKHWANRLTWFIMGIPVRRKESEDLEKYYSKLYPAYLPHINEFYSLNLALCFNRQSCVIIA